MPTELIMNGQQSPFICWETEEAKKSGLIRSGSSAGKFIAISEPFKQSEGKELADMIRGMHDALLVVSPSREVTVYRPSSRVKNPDSQGEEKSAGSIEPAEKSSNQKKGLSSTIYRHLAALIGNQEHKITIIISNDTGSEITIKSNLDIKGQATIISKALDVAKLNAKKKEPKC